MVTVSGTVNTALFDATQYLGMSVSFVVEAVTGSGNFRSSASNAVVPYVEQRDPPPCRGCQIP
jgi:hypothetical protein